MTDKRISDLTAQTGQPALGTALFETEYGGASRKVQGTQVRGFGECAIPLLATFGTTVDDVSSSAAMVKTNPDDGITLSKQNNAIGNPNRWGLIPKAIPAAPKVIEAVIERRFIYQNW